MWSFNANTVIIVERNHGWNKPLPRSKWPNASSHWTHELKLYIIQKLGSSHLYDGSISKSPSQFRRISIQDTLWANVPRYSSWLQTHLISIICHHRTLSNTTIILNSQFAQHRPWIDSTHSCMQWFLSQLDPTLFQWAALCICGPR